jgi:hypothetical protein
MLWQQPQGDTQQRPYQMPKTVFKSSAAAVQGIQGADYAERKLLGLR